MFSTTDDTIGCETKRSNLKVCIFVCIYLCVHICMEVHICKVLRNSRGQSNAHIPAWCIVVTGNEAEHHQHPCWGAQSFPAQNPPRDSAPDCT